MILASLRNKTHYESVIKFVIKMKCSLTNKVSSLCNSENDELTWLSNINRMTSETVSVSIFKSGNKSDAHNYRAISIISVFARIFEKTVHDQLYNFLSRNNILTPSQSAFRKLHSTNTSLINCTDNWYRNIDKKQLNLSLFLDLKKAFDTVDHQIMVKKLNAIGVRGIAGDWFASFLSNRKQYCSLGDQKSSESLVTCGIPQGSCLGPLLFIIYLNGFEDCLVLSKAGMYADDTHVTLKSDSLAELFESAREEMMNISEWMRIIKLSINPQKNRIHDNWAPTKNE